MVTVDYLVGRAEEVCSLEALLDECGSGFARAAAFTGEPGIGKTRLLRDLMARAERRGHLVLAGAASEFEQDLPFSLFVDALDEYLEGLEPGLLEGLDDEGIGELAGVFPSLTRSRTGAPRSGVHERYRSHRAVRALLEALAEKRPLVLLLDDLHWADSASIELLGALLRRPPAAAVLIAVAYRPQQVSRRFMAELQRAERAGDLVQIELGPLTPDESREFLGDGVDLTIATVLYEETGGNPFYLEQLARSVDRANVGSVSGESISLADFEVPVAVLASLREEIAVLSERERLVLEGAAVAGDPFDLELAAAAAEVSESTVLDGVDELLRNDLVRTTALPRRFGFRHPLVRRAVYEGTPWGWRLRAHERCADALTSRGATASARAHHVEFSGRAGDLSAVATLREAGQEALRLAPSSAARWFGAALRLLPASASSEERVALLEARARSLAAIGSFSESRADLVTCLEIIPSDLWDQRVRVTTSCAVVEHLLGMQKEAHRHLTTALAEVGDPESVEAVELMIALAVHAFHAVDFDAMRDWAVRAVGGASALGEHPVKAAALAVRAWSGAMADDTDQAQTFCDEATALVDSLSDDELAPRLITLEYLTSADLYLDRYPAATRHAQRALEIGHATGQELFPQVVSMLGASLGIQGNPLEAGKLFDEAVEGSRLSGNTQSLATHLFSRSFAALLAGDLELARVAGEESFHIEEGMEPGPLSTLAAAVLASVMLELGQADRSVDLLLTSAGGAELRQLGGSWRARYLEVLTRALLAAGRPSDAEPVVTLAQECAETVGLPTADAMASLATANLALHMGEPETAAERALAAADTFESVGALTDATWARELAGRALAQAGQTDSAAVELGRAAAAFDSFGALRYRDRAEHELRRLGRRVHRRSRPADATLGIESLTERELEVARLVVDRRTNPEIAAELFISQKTVETHLRNIFHKMSVTSRVELARVVEGAERLTAV